MSRGNLKLVSERSPQRVELAAAIADAAEAERNVETARVAVKRANDMVASASERLDATKAESARAKEAQTARMVASAASGEAMKPDGAMREARAREAEASDELDSARDALALVEAKLDDPERAHRRAQQRVKTAADAVIAGEVDRLIDEGNAVQTVLIEKRFILQAIKSGIDFQDHRESHARIEFFLSGAAFRDGGGDWRTHPATQSWRETIDALRLDADAPLPMETAR